jgi:hypothetical protein
VTATVTSILTTEQQQQQQQQQQQMKEGFTMARIPICNYTNSLGVRCTACGTVAIPVAKRGGRNAFFCPVHAEHWAMEGYNDENQQGKGTEKKHGFTFSVEFETSHTSIRAKMELVDVGFVPTRDGTVDIEYKSPIYDGLNALSKHCATAETLMNCDELGIDSDCGTHFHVGHKQHINSTTIQYIRRFYHSLFIPLCEEMQAQGNAKTAAFWGRGFTYYASPIENGCYAEAHENFVNVQHDPTIEFRLCKFRNATQYMTCAKFCRDAVNAVINNFVVHFNDMPENGMTQTEYRKHKAQIAGAKIVKLYRKYTANL